MRAGADAWVQVDVLLTHGPPYGVADTSRSSHVGDKALLHAFQALKTPPQLWVVGHIHEAYGVHGVVHESTGKEVVVINSASYYLTRGNADAAPRVVQLPSLHVSQPLGGQTAASGSKGGVWKRPQDPIVL